MELNLETFALPPLIDDVVKTIEPLAKKNGNQVAVHWTPRSGSRSRSYAKFVSQLLHNRSAAGCAASYARKPCFMRIVLANFVQPQHRRLCTPVAQASTDYSRSRKKSYVREFLGSASSLPHCIAFAEVKGGSHCCLPPEGSGEGAAPCFLVIASRCDSFGLTGAGAKHPNGLPTYQLAHAKDCTQGKRPTGSDPRSDPCRRCSHEPTQ
jgi:hypothetical protein